MKIKPRPPAVRAPVDGITRQAAATSGSPTEPDARAGRRLVAARWAGFAGGCVLAVVTSGVGLPLLAIVVVGLLAMALVVAAWLTLGTVAGELPARRLYAVAAWWALPLALARPLFSGDLWSYVAQGLITASGQDPYRLGPAQALGPDSPVTQHVSHYWVNTPAPYGPAWEALSGAVAHVAGSHLVASVLLYRAVALVGCVLIAWALPRLARRTGVNESAALWLGLLNPLVLWHLIGGAHHEAVMLGLMLVGFEVALGALGRRSPRAALRFSAGFALLVLAANVKIVAAGAAALLAVHVARRCGRPMLVVIAAGAAGLALTVALGWVTGLGLGWIGALDSTTHVYSWMAPTNQLGFLVGGVGNLFGSQATPSAIELARMLGAAIGLVLVAKVLLAVYRGRTEPVRGLGMLFAVMLLCGPVVHPWYVVWVVLPLAAAARLPRQRMRLAAFSAVIALALPPAGSGAVLLIAGYAVAVCVACAVWWWLSIRAGRTPASDIRTAAQLIRRCVVPLPVPVFPGPAERVPVDRVRAPNHDPEGSS